VSSSIPIIALYSGASNINSSPSKTPSTAPTFDQVFSLEMAKATMELRFTALT
jgi:hypothetical protein